MSVLLDLYKTTCEIHHWEADPDQLVFLQVIEPFVAPKSLYQKLFNKNPIKGIYLYGRVGRGKTALMQIVYESISHERKKYYHFHDFMQTVHRLLQAYATSKDKQPIEHVVQQIAKETRFLCLDELHVTEIANAMLIARLFQGLLKAGVFVFFTSNQKPEHLYHNQLHYERFQPFVDLVEQNFFIHHLENKSNIDYRSLFGHEHWMGFSLEENTQMQELFGKMTDGKAFGNTIYVQERPVHIPAAGNGVAKFSFHDLCGNPLGVADYLALSRLYHTIFIENVPILTDNLSNEARRFINLIDTLYAENARLVLSTETQVDSLFQLRSNLPFQRTISRLREMLAWS